MYLGQVVGDAGGHVQQAVSHVAEALLDQPWGDLLEDSVAVLQNLPTQEGTKETRWAVDGARQSYGQEQVTSKRLTALQADPQSDFLGQHS